MSDTPDLERILANKTISELKSVISDRLIETPQTAQLWAILTTEPFIDKTILALTELVTDVDTQMGNFDADEEINEEWRRKAKGFKRLVQMRIGRTKLALKEQNMTAMKLAQQWQAAARTLAEAIAEHEAQLRSTPDAGLDDHHLWAILDQTVRPDGHTIRSWLAYNPDAARQERKAAS